MQKLSKCGAAGQSWQQLEAFAARPGFMQQTPAVYKVLFTLCFIVAVVSVPKYNWPGLVPFVAYPVWAVAVIGLPWPLFLKRVAVVLPFVALLGGVNLIWDTKPVFYTLGFSMPGGWASFITLLFKALLTVGAVQLLMAGTPLNAVAGALMFLRVPCLFVMQLVLTWRYASLLTREAAHMHTAYQLRGGGGRGVDVRHWPQFIGLFLLRAVNHAQTVSNAMTCRLFDIRYIQYDRPPFKTGQVVFWCAAGGLCFIVRVWF